MYDLTNVYGGPACVTECAYTCRRSQWTTPLTRLGVTTHTNIPSGYTDIGKIVISGSVKGSLVFQEGCW